jgi:hypothetical protein
MTNEIHDGIEVHFHDERGYLELACEPDAFAAYVALAKDHLDGVPDIDFNRVKEINIADTAAFVAERESVASKLFWAAVAVCFVIVMFLAVIGFSTLASYL